MQKTHLIINRFPELQSATAYTCNSTPMWVEIVARCERCLCPPLLWCVSLGCRVLTIVLMACIAGPMSDVSGRGYECPLCDAVLHELPAMRAHLEEHYPRDSPVCPVVVCSKAFSHPNSVRNHMRMKHPVQWEKMKSLKWSYM